MSWNTRALNDYNRHDRDKQEFEELYEATQQTLTDKIVEALEQNKNLVNIIQEFSYINDISELQNEDINECAILAVAQFQRNIEIKKIEKSKKLAQFLKKEILTMTGNIADSYKKSIA